MQDEVEEAASDRQESMICLWPAVWAGRPVSSTASSSVAMAVRTAPGIEPNSSRAPKSGVSSSGIAYVHLVRACVEQWLYAPASGQSSEACLTCPCQLASASLAPAPAAV
eukprot:1143426-Pelagomonas_calceolata.AAC.3